MLKIRMAAVALVMLCAHTTVLAQAPKVLNVGYVGRQTAPEGIAMTAFAEEVKKRSNGRIEIRQHPGGALGGDREVLEGLQIGTVDITIPSTSLKLNCNRGRCLRGTEGDFGRVTGRRVHQVADGGA